MLSPLLRFVALAALAAPLLAAAASPAQPDSRELAQLAARAAVGAAPAYHLPARRSYDSHHYYAVEIRASHSAWTDPRDVAEALGAEFVERVGELRDHWLVRSPKPLARAAADDALQARQPERFTDVPLHQDAVMRRWQSLSHARFAPAGAAAFSPRELSAGEAIRSVERQELRRRHKRDVIYDPPTMRHIYPEMRAPVPGPAPHPYPDPLPRPPPIPSAKAAQMMGTHDIRDPIFAEQWHLANDRIGTNDLNISDVWSSGQRGKGINVCLIDDGLDFKSPDLKDNFFEAGSYDFNTHTALPEPRHSDDQHGTRCAGEIAAVKNDVCGVGVAYEAHVAGVRILSGPISDVDEAAALNYRYQENHVYSCSWGPPDDGRSMDAPKGLIAKAMLNGIQNGRGGKGSIFVFAGGNGGASDDQCNFDGYTNSIYSMTIAAVDREGLHPYYSEMCAANIASGWSSGSGDHIHTTDVAWNGVNRCTTHHGGTSAAAPLVAGVVALALATRPDLTWRDMQHIAVKSAVMVAPDDKDWQKTQAGRHYNHKFGYGVIDAYQFVEEAKRHVLVKPQAWAASPNISIARDDTLIGVEGVKSTFTVTKDWLNEQNLESIEHVTARVWITHERRGDVDVELTSPHGTRSVLARPRRYDDARTGFVGWGFMSLKHWGEDPVGTWTMEVFDRANPKQTGNFWAWSMTFWGETIDPAKAKVWNFPEDSVEYHETLPAAPSTTTVYQPELVSSQRPKPTDHLPEDHGSKPGETSADFTHGRPSVTPTPEADTGYISGLKSSTWLFVATGIVFIFAASLGIFFLLRRRRARARRIGDAAAYEFVPGEDDDLAMSALPGRAGSGARGGGGGRGGRRAKELYDAFGEATDDEDDGEEDKLVRRGADPQAYRDEPDDADERFTIGDEQPTPATAEALASAQDGNEKTADLLSDPVGPDAEGSGSGGSGSWQDAAAER